MKIAIIDDSIHDIVILEKALKTELIIYDTDIAVDIFSSFREFQSSTVPYFAIFLDIELGEGILALN